MYVKNPFSTVAAVSTPRGKGGIATIRISGSDTVEILEKCFVPKGKPLTERPYRTAVYGEIVNGQDILDTGVCVLYAEGKSFTGELMAELSCHGGLYVTCAVLDAVFASGAEPAGPGEFTKRAFINGKLSLSEAEEVQLESTSGTIKVSEVKAKEKMTISSASGSVRLDKCDGGEIDIETTSGSVKGTLLSSKAFDAASVSGSVSVPSSKGKDECTIRTVSGSIDISLE